MSITSTNIQTKEFTWNTNFNISFIRNELKALADGASHMYARSGFDSNFTSYDYIAKVGESLGLIYGYEFDGVYQYDDFYTDTNGNLVLKPGITQNSRYSKDKKVGARPGVTKYKDQDGDGDITTNDRTVIGNAMPKWFGGITNTFEYKGFDLSFMFQFNYGNDIHVYMLHKAVADVVICLLKWQTVGVRPMPRMWFLLTMATSPMMYTHVSLKTVHSCA